MNNKQKQKIIGISCLIILLGAGVGLVLYALKQNINLFYTPTEVLQKKIHSNQNIRVGGYVKNHSVHYNAVGTAVDFIITDRTNEIKITYQGVLPSLFREGQSVVVAGKLSVPNKLVAYQVLAKHDEKYMPASIAKKLKINSQRADV